MSVKPRGLGTSKNLAGQYDLQLTSDSLKLVIKDTRDAAVELQLVNIRRCGHTDCFFFMELGRSAVTGAGEMWIQVDDQVIAENMHGAILGWVNPLFCLESKGGTVWRVLISHQYDRGSRFVVGSLPCYERFSLGNCLVFPFPPQPTLQNSNLI